MIFNKLAAHIHRLFRPKVLSDEEIDAKLLEKRDAEGRNDLDPINSIVDLCKLFDLDSSFDARRELWAELEIEGNYSGRDYENRQLISVFRSHLAKGEIWREVR